MYFLYRYYVGSECGGDFSKEGEWKVYGGRKKWGRRKGLFSPLKFGLFGEVRGGEGRPNTVVRRRKRKGSVLSLSFYLRR